MHEVSDFPLTGPELLAGWDLMATEIVGCVLTTLYVKMD